MNAPSAPLGQQRLSPGPRLLYSPHHDTWSREFPQPWQSLEEEEPVIPSNKKTFNLDSRQEWVASYMFNSGVETCSLSYLFTLSYLDYRGFIYPRNNAVFIPFDFIFQLSLKEKSKL